MERMNGGWKGWWVVERSIFGFAKDDLSVGSDNWMEGNGWIDGRWKGMDSLMAEGDMVG